jgi:hypothetical protein
VTSGKDPIESTCIFVSMVEKYKLKSLVNKFTIVKQFATPVAFILDSRRAEN